MKQREDQNYLSMLSRHQMKFQERYQACERIRAAERKLISLRLEYLDAWQKYFRAGWDTTPNPYFLDDLHAKLAARIEGRGYKIATCRNPKERERLERIDDRENRIANFVWERMADRTRNKSGRRAA